MDEALRKVKQAKALVCDVTMWRASEPSLCVANSDAWSTEDWPLQTTPSATNPPLKQVGFEIVETRDMALSAQELRQQGGGQTWYLPLTPSYNVFSQRFQVRFLLRGGVSWLYAFGMGDWGRSALVYYGRQVHAHVHGQLNEGPTHHHHDSSRPSACP